MLDMLEDCMSKIIYWLAVRVCRDIITFQGPWVQGVRVSVPTLTRVRTRATVDTHQAARTSVSAGKPSPGNTVRMSRNHALRSGGATQCVAPVQTIVL